MPPTAPTDAPRPRIAYVCADAGIPVFGSKGASVHVQEVLRALRRSGAEPVLFATRFGGAAPPDLADLRCHALPAIPAGTPEARADAALQANAGLRRALREHGPFDWIYERYSLWSWAGMAQARSGRVPGLLEVNAPLIEEQSRHRVLAREAEARDVERRVLADASALIAVSPGVAAWLDTHAQTAGRVHVVDNGVDPARFAPAAEQVATRAEAARARAPAPAPAPVPVPTIGFLGTLKPWHGLPVLAEAFGRLVRELGCEARLCIVGDGPERERLAQRLAAQGLADRVDWLGALAPADVPAALARFDIATAPYDDGAGFYFSPLKLFEYMAAGVPVVASRVGHLDRLLDDGHDALLVPPGDAPALAEALRRLIDDPARRLALAAAARTRARRLHTWDAVAQRLLDIAAGATARPIDGAGAADSGAGAGAGAGMGARAWEPAR